MQGKGTDVIRKPIITTMYVRKHLHRVRAFSPARTFDDLSLGAVHNLSGDPRHQRHTYSPLPSPPLSPFPFPPRRAACIITVLVDFGRLSPYGHANDCMTLPPRPSPSLWFSGASKEPLFALPRQAGLNRPRPPSPLNRLPLASTSASVLPPTPCPCSSQSQHASHPPSHAFQVPNMKVK